MKKAYFIISMMLVTGVLMLTSSMGCKSASAEDLPCLQCHKSKSAGAIVHPALDMGCQLCHEAPHAEEKPSLSLTADMPDLCFQCHDSSSMEMASVHAPVSAGMCASCHDPHSSNQKKLLVSTIPEVCFGCHDEGEFTKTTEHSPSAEGQCGFCHAPHSSDNAHYLNYPLEDLCMMCHPDNISGDHVLVGLAINDVHPVNGMPDPSRTGQDLSCVSCHTPHSSNHRKLFPQDDQQENLCLLCHEKDYVR